MALTVVAASWACGPVHADVTIEPGDDRYTVKIDGELFTQYIYKGQDKPVLYPVIGPHGIGLTRNWPLADAAEGEAKDHPHHTSIWFTHGKVNGVDFWAAGPDKGKVVTTSVVPVQGNSLLSFSDWRTPQGKTLLTEERMMVFSSEEGRRIIDITLSLHAKDEPVILGDTKEGTMAIRTRPELEINHGAAAVNSEGATGKDLWGKRAGWVDYSATVEGKKIGVAILAHPSNPGAPTWHAREYGLIAGNPFGLHDFEKKPPGAGDVTIPAGGSAMFRYRFVFHEGDAQSGKVAELYARYASQEPAVPEKPKTEE